MYKSGVATENKRGQSDYPDGGSVHHRLPAIGPPNN